MELRGKRRTPASVEHAYASYINNVPLKCTNCRIYFRIQLNRPIPVTQRIRVINRLI